MEIISLEDYMNPKIYLTLVTEFRDTNKITFSLAGSIQGFTIILYVMLKTNPKEVKKVQNRNNIIRVRAFPCLRKLCFNQVNISASYKNGFWAKNNNFKTNSSILRKFCFFRRYYFSKNRKIYLLKKIRFIILKRKFF